MNAKAQSRINEITSQIDVLLKRSEILHLEQTERAQIAIALRHLLVERDNITHKKNPAYKTVDSSTLFHVVQRWLK